MQNSKVKAQIGMPVALIIESGVNRTKNQAFSIPIIHTKKEIIAADPQRIPAEAIKIFFCGNAFSISIMLENNQPIKPVMSMTDHISFDIIKLFPQ